MGHLVVCCVSGMPCAMCVLSVWCEVVGACVCVCCAVQDDGLMILCGVCGVWQHGVCFGLLEEEEVPQVHICEKCAQVSARTHMHSRVST